MKLESGQYSKFPSLKNVNVPFDTSQVKASYLFDDIYQWIDELILFAEKNTDLHFIFRSHPDEIRSDKRIYEKTSDYITGRFG